MEFYKLSLLIKGNECDDVFLLIKQARPPLFNHDEYDSFKDSDLWDLPSARFNFLNVCNNLINSIPLLGLDIAPDKIDVEKCELHTSISQALEQVGCKAEDFAPFKYLNLVKEAPFGRDFVHTLYLSTNLISRNAKIGVESKWMTIGDCFNCALHTNTMRMRIGPLVFGALINTSPLTKKLGTILNYQEYPPGVIQIPMSTKTLKPFTTTNLIVIAPEEQFNEHDPERCFVCGDALIVDPGASVDSHDELAKIIGALPRNLIVFVTHHHLDHTDGLNVIQELNPNAVLLAHESTMQRISEDYWKWNKASLSGGEKVNVGGQILEAIYAPGHTDGHMCLLHVASNSLIAGDHCVGEGSVVLDPNSGGNMSDYFRTTYNFIELSPSVVIPMHGRVNVWPKNMLCGYLKNRRSREMAILNAITNGKHTLGEITAEVYADVDPRFWKHASWNVKLHIDYLALQNKLPPQFPPTPFRDASSM